MKIELKKISLVYFKGIKQLEIEFDHVTNIFGDNATGKTTIFDAFLWLLFGKDSTNSTAFGIKTLDGKGNLIDKVDHEVSAVLLVDGREVILRRVFKEKWVKKTGSPKPEFTGHETLYFCNDVPLKEKEYQQKVNGLVDEKIFRLLTNPFYFNQTLNWKDRRGVLLEIAGTIDNGDVLDKIATLQNKDQVFNLTNILNAGTTIEEHRRTTAARKKKLKDELDTIPTRMDELKRSLPTEELDWVAIAHSIAQLEEDLSTVDSLLANKSKAQKEKQDQLLKVQSDIYMLQSKVNKRKQDLRVQLQQKEQGATGEIDLLLSAIASIERNIANDNVTLQNAQRRITEYASDRNALRSKWETENAKQFQFDDHLANCPTCKQQLPAGDIEAKKKELEVNFNKEKQNTLTRIQHSGQELKTAQENYEKQKIAIEQNLAALAIDLDAKKAQVDQLKAALIQPTVPFAQRLEEAYDNDAEIDLLNSDIEKVQQQLEALTNRPEEEGSAIHLQRKASINDQLNALRKDLVQKEQIEKTNTRIKQLEEQEEIYSQQLTALEGEEFIMDQFTRAKMDILESRINGRFKYVSFKLFDRQINGSESESCEATVHGVPFSDANNAARINAGLDIINTLCEHYGVYAPIFVDNAESVNTLVPVNAQLTRLVVSLDKKLTVKKSSAFELEAA
jgi:exonuclease SbcC